MPCAEELPQRCPAWRPTTLCVNSNTNSSTTVSAATTRSTCVLPGRMEGVWERWAAPKGWLDQGQAPACALVGAWPTHWRQPDVGRHTRDEVFSVETSQVLRARAACHHGHVVHGSMGDLRGVAGGTRAGVGANNSVNCLGDDRPPACARAMVSTAASALFISNSVATCSFQRASRSAAIGKCMVLAGRYIPIVYSAGGGGGWWSGRRGCLYDHILTAL